jgi:hypothetical protein
VRALVTRVLIVRTALSQIAVAFSWRARRHGLLRARSTPLPNKAGRRTDRSLAELSRRGRNPNTMLPRRSESWRSRRSIRPFVEPANAAAFQCPSRNSRLKLLRHSPAHASRTTVRRLTKIDQFTNFISSIRSIGNREAAVRASSLALGPAIFSLQTRNCASPKSPALAPRGLPLSARDLLEPPQGLDVPVEIRNAVHGI